MSGPSILLASAGRRPYLVRWFRDAFERLQVDGRVVLSDVDDLSPARPFADEFLLAPPVVSPGYEEWLRATLHTEGIDLALSVNDFELSKWAQLGDDEELSPLLRLSADVQDAVEDKHHMSRLLCEHNVRTPPLLVLDELQHEPDLPVVLKGRFGSGSKGLRRTTTSGIAELLPGVLSEVTERDGATPRNGEPASVIVAQEMVQGDEYGLDVVCDLDGRFVTVLARKKMAMRAGETDRAISVDPQRFQELARQLAIAVPHRGVMDVDVIVDAVDREWVIDINPRFGGGYPFSHVAGSDVPAAVVSWLIGSTRVDELLSYEAGVVGSKSVEVVRLA